MAGGGRRGGDRATPVMVEGVSRTRIVLWLALLTAVAYGAITYGFSVLVTVEAAGAAFSQTLLGAAFGGAMLTSGVAAPAVGRHSDRHGVRGVVAFGGVLGAAGLAVFSMARHPALVLIAWWGLIGPAAAMTFYEPVYAAIERWFEPADRNRAIGVVTLVAGLSGPVSIPLTQFGVAQLGW